MQGLTNKLVKINIHLIVAWIACFTSIIYMIFGIHSCQIKHLIDVRKLKYTLIKS